MTRVREVHGVALLVLLVGLLGCSAATSLDDTGASPRQPRGLSSTSLAAWDTWQTADLADYKYSLSTRCLCPFMDVTVQVLDGQVTDVDGTEMDRDGLRSLLGAEPTVEGLFTFLGEAEQKADQIDVEFDDATGVPQRIDIDYITNAIDDELSIEISGFRPGAPTAD